VPVEPVAVAGDAPLCGVLHTAPSAAGDGLVLTHGAGGNKDAPLLVAVAEAFAARGVSVLRCDLPFRQMRARGVPSPAGAARDREGLRAALTFLRTKVTGRLFLGGHSYGGRQASMLLASEPTLAHALLLQSYPLHPPGRPAALRTEHLPRLQVPTLFVHGRTDPFATPEELESARALIPARTSVLSINGGHDLGWSKRRNNSDLPERIAAELFELVDAG
jgi:uncharacterized protein